ncbi:hypothetical protein L210DRAFT_3387662 [Boletus edulis BED1]|uniref:Uncharacterized protein n=1 Tax=Boletus edulis BED1 TaxID=1328754 RepID=A0AAD4C604_BOLED|nr:hypothetical protein L210DRAFT_3387662 [Boletus edulis BED1]
MELLTCQLLLDVRTCWDSTYTMINCLHGLHQGIDYYLAAPQNGDIAKHKLSDLEWEVLHNVDSSHPRIPSAAQKMMCGECSPLLGGAIPAYETFTFQWRNLSTLQDHPHIGAFILEGLPTAMKYHTHV